MTTEMATVSSIDFGKLFNSTVLAAGTSGVDETYERKKKEKKKKKKKKKKSNQVNK